MEIKKMPRQGRGASVKQEKVGLYTIGFTEAQVDRAKKQKGNPHLGTLMSKVFKLRMWGLNNEVLSKFLAIVSKDEVGNLDMWRNVAEIYRNLGNVEKSYWAYRAGFKCNEAASIKRVSLDSLKTMAKTRNF